MLSVIWQATDFREHDWVCELFGSHIGEHVYDGKHTLVRDNCILVDKFIHQQPATYYAQFAERKNVFLFHMSDEQFHGGWENYRFFNGVFRNYWSSVFTPSLVVLPLGYSNGTSGQGSVKLASNRKYTWSFIGETRRASRPEMVDALAPIENGFCHATDAGAVPLPPAEYREVMTESVFAPCPMGRLNLECFRLYEALECGAIPIVERRPFFDYFTGLLGPNPLPAIKHWSDAQRLIQRIGQHPQDLDGLQHEIRLWWSERKLAYRQEISGYLQTRGQRKPSGEAFTRWPYQVPLWQMFELTRHQSSRALVRRVGVQSRRGMNRVLKTRQAGL